MKCCICKCVNSNRYEKHNSNKITCHRFPTDTKYLNAWLKALNLKHWKPQKHDVICSQHFEESCLDRSSPLRVRLKKTAIPSIFNQMSGESLLKGVITEDKRRRKIKHEEDRVPALNYFEDHKMEPSNCSNNVTKGKYQNHLPALKMNSQSNAISTITIKSNNKTINKNMKNQKSSQAKKNLNFITFQICGNDNTNKNGMIRLHTLYNEKLVKLFKYHPETIKEIIITDVDDDNSNNKSTLISRNPNEIRYDADNDIVDEDDDIIYDTEGIQDEEVEEDATEDDQLILKFETEETEVTEDPLYYLEEPDIDESECEVEDGVMMADDRIKLEYSVDQNFESIPRENYFGIDRIKSEQNRVEYDEEDQSHFSEEHQMENLNFEYISEIDDRFSSEEIISSQIDNDEIIVDDNVEYHKQHFIKIIKIESQANNGVEHHDNNLYYSDIYKMPHHEEFIYDEEQLGFVKVESLK